MRPYQGDNFAFFSERRYFIRWAFKLITDICSQREYTLLDETSHERIEVMWGELYCLGWIQLLNLTEKELDIMAYFLWQRMKCRKINIPDMARIWIVLYSPPQKNPYFSHDIWNCAAILFLNHIRNKWQIHPKYHQ